MDYYKDGFNVGLKWKKDYRPGGPFLCSCPHCRADKEKHTAEWFKGFDDGYEKSLDHTE